MNINFYEAKFDIQGEFSSPDKFASDTKSIFPDQNFVISRNKAGEALSVYGDNIWNLTPYNPRKVFFALRFDTGAKKLDGVDPNCIEQMKQIIFLLIYKSQTPLSVATLRHYNSLNNKMLEYAHISQCLITDLLTKEELLSGLIKFIPGSQLNHLKSLIIKLFQIGKEESGIDVIGGWAISDLTALEKSYNQKYKQHPPIPTAIYSRLIKNLLSELDDFKRVFPVISDILKESINNPLFGKCHSSRHRQKQKKPDLTSELDSNDFKTIIKQYGLLDYLESKGISMSLRGLGAYLTETQRVCKLVIHVYSGMRDEEAQYLLYDCISSKTYLGKKHYFFEGVKTKLGVKKTLWVTSREGLEAANIAKSIADFIYKNCINVSPLSDKTMEYPLFISTSYFPFIKSNIKSDIGYGVTHTDLHLSKKLLNRILLCITKEDISELERIDQHRAWLSEEKFQIGARWSLTTHQLRRSLALYATSSGLVSLTSLKRQLQHITEEMALYYARGSAYAKSIAGESLGDFAVEYQMALPEGQALSWIFNVLFSPEKLQGAHGTWVENNIKSEEGFLITHDRDETIKKFKNGQMAYKETPLGGCATVDPCNNRAMRSLVSCLDCKSAIIKPSKLSNVIIIQRSLVESLDVNSVEYKIELEDLHEFEKAEKKYLSKGN